MASRRLFGLVAVFLACYLIAGGSADDYDDYDDGYDGGDYDQLEEANWTAISGGSTDPPPPLFKLISTPEGLRQAHELRSLLRDEARKNPDRFDLQDVQDILNGSLWHVARFMRPASTADEANVDDHSSLAESWQRMQTNLKWRQTMRLSEQDPAAAWPCEFWLSGIAHVTVPRNTDPAEGGASHVILIEFPKISGYDGQVGDEWTRFLHWMFDQIDRWAGWSTWHILITFNGLHWSLIPNTEVVTALYPVVEHFPAKMSKLNADRSGLGQASSLLGMSVDVMTMASPEETKKRIRWLRSDAELYGYIKKRDLPEHMGGRLAASKSLFSEVFADLENIPEGESPLEKCVGIRQMNWEPSEVEKFLTLNEASIESNGKALNFEL